MQTHTLFLHVVWEGRECWRLLMNPLGKMWFFGLVLDILPHVGCSVHCLEKWVATLRCF